MLKKYFDGKVDYAKSAKTTLGYQKLKGFTERFYPETEIISINPVGLKGLFHDVYTEEYLAVHPEIDRNECEILDITKYTGWIIDFHNFTDTLIRY